VRAVEYATFSRSSLAVTLVLVLAGVLVAACADSAEVPAEETSSAAPAPAPETTLPPASTAVTPPAAQCAPSCETNTDCAKSCPELAGGVHCCDTKTKTCWGSKTSTCPKPVVETDPGDPPPSY
jgi:hypothetical protein